MMKRSTISLSAENFGRVAIDIGRVAENQAVQVRVDLSKFLLQEPKATASLAVESPGGDRYPAITRMEGQALIWDVAAADVASAGMGKVQLNVLGPNGEVLKSAVAVTRISASIAGDGQAPEPVQAWLDSAQKAVNEANEAAEVAQDAAADVKEKLDAGEFVGPQGPQGPKGEPGNIENLSKADIISALGYTPQSQAVENHDGEIVNLFPDQIEVLVSNFYKQGALCLLVYQIKVNESISGNYGFNLAKLPFSSLHRAWINYGNAFYIDGNEYIRVNNESIAAGGYMMSAHYFTNG